MNEKISPRYIMSLIGDIENKIWQELQTDENAKYYIEKWIEGNGWDYQNFTIAYKNGDQIDIPATLNRIDGETLLKIAIDLGVETPDFIPSIPVFRNEIKTSFETASATFERAFKTIEEHPDLSIGLANSALESIIKEIIRDDSIKTQYDQNKTLYQLTTAILKEFKLYPENGIPDEIRQIGSAMLTINQNIEKLRSEKTNMHGKVSDDYIVNDPMYAYFIVNSVSTIGLFLNSFYRKKYPIPETKNSNESESDDLPF
jgi:hypothetical protein